jgi:predicted O-methyltransferase YrrM
MGRFDRELAMKLHLPDVTLVMIDTQCHELARLAMEDSLHEVEFGDAIIFSDEPIEVAGTRWIKVPKWPNIAECSHFMWYELPDYIDTKWAINIQWDSWVVNADCWTDEFLQFDYVGAPWWYDDNLNVGNGCALRSRSLMQFLRANRERFPLSLSQEDHLISRVYRTALEEGGFKWPTEALASRFSLECTRPSSDSRHFMFHDSFNFPAVLEGERLAERLRLMRANPAIARKVAENDKGRRAIILPRLGVASEKADNRPAEVIQENAHLPNGGAGVVPTFREFQKKRIDELLTTRRCLYPGDSADVHNFLPGLVELILRAKPRTVIEIGSDRGVSTELFLLTSARVVAVDPWENRNSLQEFTNRCGAYHHLEICRGKCPDALDQFGAEFDLCYIDADHGYEAVRRDILACTRIVKPDGWLAGHDYHQPQVESAVLSMIDEPIVFRDGSWLAKNRLSDRVLAGHATEAPSLAELACAV